MRGCLRYGIAMALTAAVLYALPPLPEGMAGVTIALVVLILALRLITFVEDRFGS